MLRLFLTLPIFLSAWLKDETVSGYAQAVYRLETLNGAAFAARATIGFPRAGVIEGEAPCNRYSARQTAPYPWFGVEAIVATQRACPDLGSETAFFAALRSMTLAEAVGDTLVLSNDAGGEMVFRADQD